MTAVLGNAIRIFLPSQSLGRYIARLYMIRFAGLLLGIVAVLQMLDLLAASDAILAAEGADYNSILRYISLRLPQLLSQFIPFTALLATLLTLATLNQSSEIIVMKASGLSAFRILLPLLLPSALIGVAHFAFNETVLVSANAELQYWEDNAYAVDLPPPPEYAAEARIIEDGKLILTEAVSRNGNVVILDKVSIYEQAGPSQLGELTRANFATHVDGTWRLFEVRRFDPQTQTFTAEDNRIWDLDVGPDRFFSSTVQPDFVNFFALARTIKRLEGEGRNVTAIKSAWYQKLSQPFSVLLMPLLAAIAGFGVHRAGSLLLRVVLGMALGFTFFVADNFMLAMGQFGVAPPPLAAGGPLLLFLSLGLAMLFVTEE